jgi:hypothetical protein
MTEFEDLPYEERQRAYSAAGVDAVKKAFAAGVPVCGSEGDKIVRYYPDGKKKVIGNLK